MASKNATADSKPLSPWIRFGVPIGIVLVIIFSWAITPRLAFLFFRFYSVEELSGTPTFQDLGVVGDSFGLINALFTGGALVGVIVAIFLQNQELKLMHVEMRGQKEQLEGQRRALERSNLNDSFSQLLKLRSDILEGLQMRMGAGVTMFFTQQFEKHFRDSLSRYVKDGGDKTNLQKLYSWYWENSKREMDHYYGNLESILLLIDTCDYDTWIHYARILMGCLSLDEKILLFYHAAADDRTHKRNFRSLVEKAGLVDGVDRARLIHESHVTELKRMQGQSALNRDNEDIRQYLRQVMDG